MATINQFMSTTISKTIEEAQVAYQYNLNYSRNTEDGTYPPASTPTEIRVSASFNAPGVSSSIIRRYSPDGTYQVGDYPMGVNPTQEPLLGSLVIYPFTEAFDAQVLADVTLLFSSPSALETFN